MATTTARRRLAARNARLLQDNDMRPAPHTPPPLRRGMLDATTGRLKRDSSTIETKRVPEEVGCTLTKLDWKQNLRTTETSRANSGTKLQHADLGDGSLATARRMGRA